VSRVASNKGIQYGLTFICYSVHVAIDLELKSKIR
jgi:hypothetical protein